MMPKDTGIYTLLAGLLEYPSPGVVGQAEACHLALAERSGEAQAQLDPFVKACRALSLSRLEELYTDTFDLQALCCPYVGYHLFGEERSRGLFMVRLQGRYRAQGLPVSGELPDHIGVMLRSLADGQRDGETRDLISLCLLPAGRKMVSRFQGGENPYQGVLAAMVVLLEQEAGRS